MHTSPERLSRRALLGVGLATGVGLVAGCAQAPREASMRPSPPGLPAASPEPTASSTPTPTATPWSDPWPPGAFTALLAGTDTWEDPARGRPDVLVVAQVNAARDHLTLVSLPRDAWVPIDGGREGKVNASYGGDIERTRRTVSAVLGGLPLQATALTGFSGYSAIVDALGHLEVDNTIESTFIDPTDGHASHFPQGRITLSTADWLVYARQRKELPRGDLDRTARHRAILVGMLRRIRQVAREDPAAFARLAAAVLHHVRVTGPLGPDALVALAPRAAAADPDAVTTLMVPVAGTGTRAGQSVTLLDGPLTAELAAALASGDVADYARRTAQNPRTR